MIRTSIAAAAVLSATAIIALPAAVNAAQYDGSASTRTWTGKKQNSGSPASATTANRGSGPTQRAPGSAPSTYTNVPKPAPVSTNSYASRDHDDEDHNRYSSNERGRNASAYGEEEHRDHGDRYVRIDSSRDRDGDEGERRHNRRRHFWHRWW